MQRLNLAKQNQQHILDITCKVLETGGLIIFPTETTYGVGVDATNPVAVEKLLQYKSRREGKPLSIAVSSQEMAAQYVRLTDQAVASYQQFLPGPVTVVSESLGNVAPGVASEFGTLGIRIPDYPLIVKLVSQFGKPITATSANMSGGKRPYDIDSLLADLPAKQQSLIDLVLDAGKLPPNPPSLVIDTTLSAPVTLRERDDLTPTQLTTLESDSPEMTARIAGTYLLKYWTELTSRGLIIGLDGELGTGKTVFTKGAAAFLGVNEALASPTYTYIESYDFSRHEVSGRLHHCDLWKIQNEAELKLLEIETLLGPRQLVIIEWWDQVADWILPLLQKKHIPLLQATLTDADNTEQRTITINEQHAK